MHMWFVARSSVRKQLKLSWNSRNCRYMSELNVGLIHIQKGGADQPVCCKDIFLK